MYPPTQNILDNKGEPFMQKVSILFVCTLSTLAMGLSMVSTSRFLVRHLEISSSDMMQYYWITFLPWNFKWIGGLAVDLLTMRRAAHRLYIAGMHLVLAICLILQGTCVSTFKEALAMGVVVNILFVLCQSVLDALSIEMISGVVARRIGPFETETSKTIARLSSDIQAAYMVFRTLGTLVSTSLAIGVSYVGDLATGDMVCLCSIFPLMSMFICLMCRDIEEIPAPMKGRGYAPSPAKRQIIKPIFVLSLFIIIFASRPTSHIATSHYLYSTATWLAPFEYSIIDCMETCGAIFGTLIYWAGFRNQQNLKLVFVITVIASAGISLLGLLIIHVSSGAWKIGLIKGAVGAAYQMSFMPVLVTTSVAAASPNLAIIKGFVYNLLLSINNWGGTLSGVLSSEIASHLSLSTLIATCSAISLTPICFLFLISPPIDAKPVIINF